ncbi:hypothetical protein GTQ40_12650 [Flavobacteriaceae bacterium R38]|nr:hypothetical protein [Flavobacteriaceae bacterium R38]
MKKKKANFSKLSLGKKLIAKMNTDSIKGGTGDTIFSVQVCETVDFTACYGNFNCMLFQTQEDCQRRSLRC